MPAFSSVAVPKGLRSAVYTRSPRSVTARAFIPDLHMAGALHQLSQLHVLSLADLGADAVNGAVEATTETVKASGGGPFDLLAKGFETALTAIDRVLESAHIPYSYGFSIIILTILVKIATFPLSQKQVESTMAVQALQPSVKQLQAKHANDPERLQLETARLYKEANVNPLAGCLPTLATIPVFIGLYRALTLAAQDGLLSEGFFFIPSLGGPTTLEQQVSNQGLSWLVPFVDGAPPLGWVTTAKYLVLPVLLIFSQYASMAISQPANSDDPQVKQTQAILRYLPLLIGWFSLSVPSGLTIYWLTNNILTTGQQVYLKSVTKVEVPKPQGTIVNTTATEVGAPAGQSGAEMGSRRSRKGETFRARRASEESSTVVQNARGKRKGAKFAERKAAGSSTAQENGQKQDGGVVEVTAEPVQAKGDKGSNSA